MFLVQNFAAQLDLGRRPARLRLPDRAGAGFGGAQFAGNKLLVFVLALAIAPR
jgi:hypothetical protein